MLCWSNYLFKLCVTPDVEAHGIVTKGKYDTVWRQAVLEYWCHLWFGVYVLLSVCLSDESPLIISLRLFVITDLVCFLTGND